jgi:nucleoside-diphosphate-sugar epimerase
VSAAEPCVAVLGASGFIGNRIVEVLYLDSRWRVRPVARRASGLALACRFDLRGVVADGFDVAALTAAFEGCDLVVHALAGDMRTVRGTVAPVYRAAERAGCRRMIYLSSAMVHGQAPAAGADENSPLPAEQRLPYNLAKRAAENILFRLGRTGKVEVVALRPGIVYGPRSQWIGGIADALLEGRAGLVDGGGGLCNAIYVDNVVHAVRLAAITPGLDGQAFLLGEDETPSWREFTRRVAEALGLRIEETLSLEFVAKPPAFRERLDLWRLSRPVRTILESLPRPLREGLAAAWGASGAMPPPASGPRADLEMALLHRAAHVPSWRKAREQLGYSPLVLPPEAWRRTISWLGFAGYPIGRV